MRASVHRDGHRNRPAYQDVASVLNLSSMLLTIIVFPVFPRLILRVDQRRVRTRSSRHPDGDRPEDHLQNRRRAKIRRLLADTHVPRGGSKRNGWTRDSSLSMEDHRRDVPVRDHLTDDILPDSGRRRFGCLWNESICNTSYCIRYQAYCFSPGPSSTTEWRISKAVTH